MNQKNTLRTLGAAFGYDLTAAAELLYPEEESLVKTKDVTEPKLSEKATTLATGARVKNPGDALGTKRHAVNDRYGNPLAFAGRNLESSSERDKAVIGVFFKAALRKSGLPVEMTEWERSLLAECVEKDGWVGSAPDGTYYGGGMGGYAPADRVKSLLDDTVSGGLYLNPVVLDEAVVTYPLLSGELYPLVDVVPVTGRRVMTPTMGNLSVGWGQASGTAVTPFNTAALVSSLDTPVHPVSGFLEIGNDLLSDSPVNIGAQVTALYGERLKSELDRVIAVGNGFNEPLGIGNTSGLTLVTSDNGPAGPPTVSDTEQMIFAVPVQYRRKDWNPCFIANDTGYRRYRGIPVGPSDERRVFGMEQQSYTLFDYPFKVQNALGNTTALFGCMKRYRLYQRLGMEFVVERGGRQLALSNQTLVGLRARFGGRVLDPAAFALMVDAQE